ncbi:hypothetical protein VNI00_005641 [Paramarasmius palmivorus]|uniref:Cytochrome c oxidase subunit 8, mitochondrial n=1 Tax=Paramarasmius palmivorus TaxID=297713 RepID=A0AAW0DD39_9AGAR
MLAAVTRTAIRRPIARSFQTSAPSRSAHGEYHHLPFAWPHSPSARKIFAASITSFLGLGFALPFIAAGFQIKKSSGGTD